MSTYGFYEAMRRVSMLSKLSDVFLYLRDIWLQMLEGNTFPVRDATSAFSVHDEGLLMSVDDPELMYTELGEPGSYHDGIDGGRTAIVHFRSGSLSRGDAGDLGNSLRDWAGADIYNPGDLWNVHRFGVSVSGRPDPEARREFPWSQAPIGNYCKINPFFRRITGAEVQQGGATSASGEIEGTSVTNWTRGTHVNAPTTTLEMVDDIRFMEKTAWTNGGGQSTSIGGLGFDLLDFIWPHWMARWHCMVQETSNGRPRVWAGLFDASATSYYLDDDPPTDRQHVAFLRKHGTAVGGNWWASVCDGTTLTQTELIGFEAGGSVFTAMEIRCVNHVYYWIINGKIVHTQSADVPTGTFRATWAFVRYYSANSAYDTWFNNVELIIP